MKSNGIKNRGVDKTKKIVGIIIFMLVFCVAVCSVTVIGTNNKTMKQQSSSPEIEWIHTFDSIVNDRAYYVEQTMDGGYIFTGSTVVTPPHYTELLLAKTDGNGEESWHNNFPMYLTNLYGKTVHQTTDSGYIIVGSVGGSWLWDVQVTKTDANGDLVWQKSFGKNDKTDHGYDILQTSDDGYIVLGLTNSYGQGSGDLWLIKLAADGTEQWNKTIGGEFFDEPKSFTKTVDGGYIIVGCTDANDGMGDVWVVKTDETGEVSWQKTYGSSNFCEDGVCVKAVSNGYIILGNILEYENWTESLWLLHLNSQGTLTWDQQICDNVHGTSITTTTDGGYFITGAIIDNISFYYDIYLLKLNYQCAIQWDTTLDISNGLDDYANWGIQERDGGYVAIGSTGDFFNKTVDTFILKIEAENGVVLDSVTGGFGVHTHLKNLDTKEATNVNVSIKITGGIFNRINISHMDTINIPAGEEATVSCKPFLGLGSIDIAVTVNGVTNEYEGKQLIILTRLLS